MNAVTSQGTAEATAPRSSARPLADRLLAVVPLLSVYAWLCVVYLVEVWNRRTPWLFTDELELTQLSRSFASTGHAARRGQPHSPDTLYTVLTAPAWLIHRVATAYATVKDVDVLVMTSVVFPTYFLARLVVGRRAALFAAAAAGVIPSLAYTGSIVEENLAYPYATLCLFLIAKALVELRRGGRARRWVAAAVVASIVAPVVRGELLVIPLTALLALLLVAWSSEWARERRRGWSWSDWLGAVLLALGAVFLLSGIASHESLRWYGATTYYKQRMLDMGGWAAGSLAVGIGVIPVAAGLASLFRAPGEGPSRELRVFRSVLLASLVTFGFYTALKATILSWTFATRVEERNLLYVSPLLFVGTAILLERRRVNLWALLGSAGLAAYLVLFAIYHPTQAPYEMNVQLYSDALGLAILQQANRFLYWTPETARLVLLAITLVGTAALVLVHRLGPRSRLAAVVAAVLGVGVVGWTLTGEIAAAAGSNSFGRDFATTLSPTGQPFSWVDEATKGAPTLYMGEGEADQNPEWLLEFWNRSIARVSSLDGTVGGPGPADGPNLTANGSLYWTDSAAHPGTEYAYAVEDVPCIDFAGALVAAHAHRAGGLLKVWHLVRLTRPNRLSSMCTGLYPDGWSGAGDTAYFRFAGAPAGWLRVVVSRRDWGGPTPPSPVHVLVGRLVINANAQPILGRVVSQRNLVVGSGQTKVVWVPAPGPRFAVHVVVDRKFVPAQSLSTSSDSRTLGAEITYRYFAALPKGVRP